MANPAPTQSSCIVIFDGSIACVVASWLEGVCRAGSGPRKAALWVPQGTDGLTRRVAERLVETAQLGELIDGAAPLAHTGTPATTMLMSAGHAAITRRADRIIWPVQLPGELLEDARITEAVTATDRALLTARLLSVDAEGPGLTIDTPMLDLTDRQLIELAADLDAPVGLARWCQLQAEVSGKVCGTCPGCKRWVPAIHHGGLIARVAGIEIATVDPEPAASR